MNPSTLNLPELLQWQPDQLKKIADSQSQKHSKKIRNIDEILQAIESIGSSQITPLEWVACIHNKAEWDKENPHHSIEAALSIWQAALENIHLEYLLHRLLLYRLVLYYGGNTQALAASLVKGFSKIATSLASRKPLTVKIIEAISSNNPGQNLARLSCQYLKLPIQLFNQEQLPTWGLITQESLNYIVEVFLALIQPNNQQVNWLLTCLNEMSQEQQIKAVNNILTSVPTEIGARFPELVDWLRKKYGTGKLRYRLSETAKRKLQDWIGAVNYDQFQKLAQLILERLPLEDFEANQLRRRQEFWGYYSNRFERIRILLPQESLRIIGNELSQNVDLLEEDGSNSTEVCIFDFGDWLIVEIFRGPGSETRLFPRSENRLFDAPNLSLKRIRRLGGEIHDHKYLWQFSCEKWLYEKKIYLNPGISPSREPTQDKLRERERKLFHWREEIKRLEREANNFDFE